MKDRDCVRFLQWALPRLGLRWPGFRKVRKQVGKRVGRRIVELRLAGVDGYIQHLAAHPDEWEILDGLCRITISRFYRDRRLFEDLGREILPGLAAALPAGPAGEEPVLRCWCAGCASGEEPYTLRLLWNLVLQKRHPGLEFAILATDADDHLLERARRARYPLSSLRNLPADWKRRAFLRKGNSFALLAEHRQGVEFRRQDIRAEVPAERFQLVMCRNLAFTYFATDLQVEVLQRLWESLRPDGVLAIGAHESLPPGETGFAPAPGTRGIFRRKE